MNIGIDGITTLVLCGIIIGSLGLTKGAFAILGIATQRYPKIQSILYPPTNGHNSNSASRRVEDTLMKKDIREIKSMVKNIEKKQMKVDIQTCMRLKGISDEQKKTNEKLDEVNITLRGLPLEIARALKDMK